MKSDNPFSCYTETVRQLLQPIHHELAELLVDDNLEVVFEDHNDNWHGGIDYYHMVFKIPVKLYISLKNDNQIVFLVEQLEECYNAAMGGSEDNLVLTRIILQPSARIVQTIGGGKIDDSMWQRGFFRLFISHCSESNQSAKNLKIGLRPYGIDAFVAHVDIAISKKWTEELENALFTMDALVANLTNSFKSSDWCDQEVGIALGQRKLVIPIAREQNPYGIMGQLQALMIKQKSLDARVVARSIWKIIVNDKRTRDLYWEKLIDLFFSATSVDEALEKLVLFQEEADKQVIEKLHNSYPATPILKSTNVLERTNAMFKKWNLSVIPVHDTTCYALKDDNLPF